MDRYDDVTGVLLAGGRSDRMGSDKALLGVNGVPIVQMLASRLREITDEVMISTNNPSGYEFLGLPIGLLAQRAAFLQLAAAPHAAHGAVESLLCIERAR